MERARDRHKLFLWIGMLLPPAAWSGALEAVYLTNGYTCAGSAIGWSHLSSAIGFVLCLVGGAIAWASLRPDETDDANAEPRSRDTFMAHLGIVLAIFFALLTIAQWLPVAYGVPCSK